MTAVISPSNIQSGARLGWYSSGNEGQAAVSPMNADDASRTFTQRKTLQRSGSSSSLRSNSSASTVLPTSSNSHAVQNSITGSGTWSPSKKKTRNHWLSSKAEPVSGVTSTRSQPVSSFSSRSTASSVMSAIHQPSSLVPSQHILHPSQQNGIRASNGTPGSPRALLTLVPTNGTFEGKHISVPYFPEVIRVGRQTNAKTIPTPGNGYFDSKVLSRQHAEIWADMNGRIWIRDVKSSNGTFVNGERLSLENHESEPHELRENDTLELGIDIVSEDQKTVVHHKVSARVDHAGIYGNSILDLSFEDLDPASGSGLLPSPVSQPIPHHRGRAGSNMSNRSAANNQFNVMHQQRQMNYWSSPISVEQVVKRLASEMRQAKQQSQDLRQADDFLATIVKPEYMEKERAKHSQPDINPSHQMNGRPKMLRVDSFSRFSDPPAPPPQQPLPEKPDALSRCSVDSVPSLKRSDTEKSKLTSVHSATSGDSSRILSLVEALSLAKRELDSQGARVKELEVLLLQERAARESAEARAKDLEGRPGKQSNSSEVAGVSKPPMETSHRDGSALQSTEKFSEPGTLNLAKTNGVTSEALAPVVDDRAVQLQRRLEAMMREVEDMRQQVAIFKGRASQAEDESVKARASLADMIESLRRERDESDKITCHKLVPDAGDNPTSFRTAFPCSNNHNNTAEGYTSHVIAAQRSIEASTTSTSGTDLRKQSFAEQSSPYASMLGVVLLGIGLMAYLNGWQKMER